MYIYKVYTTSAHTCTLKFTHTYMLTCMRTHFYKRACLHVWFRCEDHLVTHLLHACRLYMCIRVFVYHICVK